MYITKLFSVVLDIGEPGGSCMFPGQLHFETLNKARLYLVCVPNKVKGELSVNIQFFVCVTKELIR